jgi:hypothetical protein
MAVAFDAASESHTGTSGSTSAASFTWTHTPSGTPRGILVYTFSNANADDATAVTYGGLSLTAVSGGRAVDTAGEAGDCKTWYLGVGVQLRADDEVVVTRTNNTDEMYAVAITVTANSDTEVYAAGVQTASTDGTLAEVSVTDNSPGSNSVRFGGVNSGLSGIVDNPTTPGANNLSRGTNSTALVSIDFANRVIQVVRETTAGQGARSVGFSASTSDDRAAVYLAVRETFTTTLTAGVGALSLTGQAPAIPVSISPSAGTLTLTGQAPTVVVPTDIVRVSWAQFQAPEATNTTVSPSSGALVVTGQAPTANVVHSASPSVASLVLTGQAPTANVTYSVAPDVASLVLTGQAPTANVVHSASPSSASLSLTGQAPSVVNTTPISYVSWAQIQVPAVDSLVIGPAVGSLVLTGQAPTANVVHSAAPGVASLVLTGQAPVSANTTPISYVSWAQLEVPEAAGVSVSPSSASLVLTGQAPTVAVSAAVATVYWAYVEIPEQSLDVTISPSAGALVVTGQAPTLAIAANTTVEPSVATLTLTGQAPTANVVHSASPDVASLSITGQAPTANVVHSAAPGVASLSITGQAPTVVQDVSIAPGAAALNFATFAPSLSATANWIVVPDAAQLVLGAFDPVSVGGISIASSTGAGSNRRRRKRYELPNGLHVYATPEEAEAAALEILRSEAQVVEPKNKRLVIPTIEPIEFDEIKPTRKKASTAQDPFVAFTQTADLDAIAVEDILNTLRRRRRAKALLLAS